MSTIFKNICLHVKFYAKKRNLLSRFTKICYFFITNFTFLSDDSYSLAVLEYVGALSEDIPLTTILCKGNSHSIVCQYSDGIGIRKVLLEDGTLSVGQIYGTNSNVSDSYLIPKALYKLVIE